jgi:hypothetical protein
MPPIRYLTFRDKSSRQTVQKAGAVLIAPRIGGRNAVSSH